LSASTLAGANLTGAIVTGANFEYTTSRGFTKDQLYSTASYQQKNLQGIGLGSNDVRGWDLTHVLAVRLLPLIVASATLISWSTLSLVSQARRNPCGDRASPGA
jgi:uncharacterized protein YjbI with pentapeptide repeats